MKSHENDTAALKKNRRFCSKSRCFFASLAAVGSRARACSALKPCTFAHRCGSLRVASGAPCAFCKFDYMSTSGQMSSRRPADDDDAATVAAADERNDNEAARDAAATALWTRCLEHAGTSPRDQNTKRTSPC